MKSLWNDRHASVFRDDLLGLRVYSSRLLGQNPDLVLHGGGNTSVKITETNLFGETEELLYVKGSGWDLATIQAEGFAPVRMKALLQMVTLPELSDSEMVKLQRAAMTDPYAPNPSVEAILHAILPFRFVDHTHADAVVTVSNTPEGARRIQEIYGEEVLIVPYVMPGFVLAQKVYALTQNVQWDKLTGIILLQHGVFTFHDEAKESYLRMIRLVTLAERYLKRKKAGFVRSRVRPSIDLHYLARLRKAVAAKTGSAVIVSTDTSPEAVGFSSLKNVSSLVSRGPLTPDHIIRTKRTAMVAGADPVKSVEQFTASYEKYFNRFTNGKLTMLDSAPRWAVWPGRGILHFGKTLKDARIVQDITRHTIRAIQQAEKLGGWKALPQKALFDVEYWELEQAKLKKGGIGKIFQGKIAIVTGAASGIGKACVEALLSEGAVVAALDMRKDIGKIFYAQEILPLQCDVTREAAVKKAIEKTVLHFGGLDMLVSNAGVFTKSAELTELDEATWNVSMAVNLNSHRLMLKYCLPFLEHGLDPAVVIIGSKNVPAPGPAAAAYSAAKAALTQLARVAALESGRKGIRVNVVHPNAVFDTAIWTDEVLRKRAAHYGLTVEAYKKNNVLHTEVRSKDVARMVVSMLGPAFSKTTGAQVPVDGGNERII
ncbi:MAG: short-chain dehydrogenase [Chitinophagales bacterium]|nr:MAG: short-chain dehydrogenase [Chitinophagales bacterium]